MVQARSKGKRSEPTDDSTNATLLDTSNGFVVLDNEIFNPEMGSAKQKNTRSFIPSSLLGMFEG